MAMFGRVMLWTVALVAPGGFLLLPVLVAFRGSGPGVVGGRLTRGVAWLKMRAVPGAARHAS